jgi:hypothetical protein
MATIGDVIVLYQQINALCIFFDCPDDFLRECCRRFREIGDALKKELKICSLREAARLPPETQLTSEAEVKFNDLRVWLAQK